jgi:hypothetical protein
MDPALRSRIIEAVRAPLQAGLTSSGVALGASCWIVTASA